MLLIGFIIGLLTVVLGISDFAAKSETGYSDDISFAEFTEQSLLWAPYRSNCYFGIRPRNVNESPFILGLMWFDSSDVTGISRLRHFVEQGDKLTKYGWEVYDPRIGGREVIIDEESNLNLTIYFTKSHDGENWAVRVNGKPIDPSRKSTASIVLYVSQNGDNGASKLVKLADSGSSSLNFHGSSEEIGEYQLIVRDNYGKYHTDPLLSTMEIVPGCDSSKTAHISLTIPDNNVWKAGEVFQTLLSDSVKAIVSEKVAENVSPTLMPSIFTIRNQYNFPPGNFHYVQKTFDNSNAEGFEFDIIYNKLNAMERIESAEKVTNLITWSLSQIEAKFNKYFQIQPQDDEHRAFALETLSNLLGGIGYFHGTQLVDRTATLDDEQFKEVKLTNPVEEGPLSLFTSVPSRAAFPRGFYWDEGFHLLQIMEYDFDLAFVIVSSWFDLIEDDSGWIAREVILGDEARSKVPEEFRVQNPNIANPPTLLLAFSEMLDRTIRSQENVAMNYFEGDDIETSFDEKTNQLEKNPNLLLEYAKDIYPKLLKHYEWFRTSQRGLVEEYEEIFEEEGISDKVHKNETYRWRGRTIDHCLPSGLDDYPRAQPPDIAELNVDALAWVGVMTRSMKKIAHILNLEDDEIRYQNLETNIVENLDILHWSKKNGCYCDITMDDEYEDAREFVCHEGYVSILPFALKLMPKDSPKLAKILSLMSDPTKIFSDYGILSLSRQDEYFGKGENYWRGPIWMNINYLCLDALKYYYPEVVSDNAAGAENSADEQKLAKQLFTSLKANLIENVFRNWKEKQYCYEYYDQKNGQGKGIEHFTGWTALIVNIMGQ